MKIHIVKSHDGTIHGVFRNLQDAVSQAKEYIHIEAKKRHKLNDIYRDEDGEGFYFFTTRDIYGFRVIHRELQ